MGEKERDKEGEKYLDGYEFLHIHTWQLQSGLLDTKNKPQEFKFHKEQKIMKS